MTTGPKPDDPLYHAGQRALQDRFDSRRIADRLEQVTVRGTFSEADRAFIAGSAMFFLATADEQGRPDCSYKGGAPGFVQVVADDVLVFPDYDGNGMFRSLGNIAVNPAVGLLFIDFEHPARLRVNGTASSSEDDPLLGTVPGATVLVRVTVQRIFPNCPRYVHPMVRQELSPYLPQQGVEAPVPKWKTRPELEDALPRRRR